MRLLSLVLLSLAGSLPITAQEHPPVESAVASANAHACEMLQFFREMTAGNFCFSPYSSHKIALLLTGAAKGPTQQELAGLAHIEADLSKGFTEMENLRQLLAGTTQEGRQCLEISTSLWSTPGGMFQPTFIPSAQARFGASMEMLPTGGPVEWAAAVNRWARHKTNGRVTQLVGPNVFTNARGSVLAVNTLFMNGVWTTGFDPRLTQMRPFYRPHEKVLRATMHQPLGRLRHGEDKDWQCLGIPMAGGDLSLVILLPRTEALRPKLEKELTPAVWQQAVRSLSLRDVNAMVPRFSYSTQLGLKPLWQALGAKRVFTPLAADLTSALKTPEAYVTDVLQETSIEVNEKGVIASAATLVAADPFGTPPPKEEQKPKPIVFMANRPFLWLLRHDASDLILFMGRYAGD